LACSAKDPSTFTTLETDKVNVRWIAKVTGEATYIAVSHARNRNELEMLIWVQI
jgi:hypothetical protein